MSPHLNPPVYPTFPGMLPSQERERAYGNLRGARGGKRELGRYQKQWGIPEVTLHHHNTLSHDDTLDAQRKLDQTGPACRPTDLWERTLQQAESRM